MNPKKTDDPVWEVKKEGQLDLNRLVEALASFLVSIWQSEHPSKDPEKPESQVKPTQT